MKPPASPVVAPSLLRLLPLLLLPSLHPLSSRDAAAASAASVGEANESVITSSLFPHDDENHLNDSNDAGDSLHLRSIATGNPNMQLVVVSGCES